MIPLWQRENTFVEFPNIILEELRLWNRDSSNQQNHHHFHRFDAQALNLILAMTESFLVDEEVVSHGRETYDRSESIVS